MILSLLGGLVIGVVNIGAQTWRTIQVLNGQAVATLFSSALISLGYYITTTMIVKQDVWGYVGFSIGAAGVSMAMAARRRPAPTSSLGSPSSPPT